MRVETFLQQYTEAVGGVMDEIEPEVYDVLLPSQVARVLGHTAEDDEEAILRLTFDPEAVTEHPNAQLLTFGSPLLDRLFEHAHERCPVAQAYLTGFHLSPHDLPRRIQHALTLPSDVTLEVAPGRPLYFGNAVFWFQATFVSDEKKQEVFPTAVDLYHGRQVRHIESLLDPPSSLSLVESRPFLFPDAPRLSLHEAYRIAWEQVVGTVAAIAGQRQRDLAARMNHQMERMRRYFQDMRDELDERIQWAESRGNSTEALESRRNALAGEERLRLSELRQKAMLRVEMRLMNLLWIKQPKVQVHCRLTPKKGNPGEVVLHWDPLTEKIEAFECPLCQRPSLSLTLHWAAGVVCQECG